MTLTTEAPAETALAPDLQKRLRRRLSESPALRWLQPTLEELRPDFCVLAMPHRPEVTNVNGAVHGGVLAALADTAVAFALATNFDGKMGFATSDLTIHFLRRARGEIRARARIIKKGRRVCVGEVAVVDASGEEVARALTTFILTTSTFGGADETERTP